MTHGQFHFDELYSGAEPVWSGEPNGTLVQEVSGVTPGRALDVGCGEGADAVWLAQRGWQVTALDPAKGALDRAERAAAGAGVEVRWLHAGLLDAPLSGETFDLVSAQYPALPRTPGGDAVRALLALVALGGTLLVVHHADVDLERALEHGCDPRAYVSPADVLAALDDGWEVLVDERRERHVSGGAGVHHTHDTVVRARRRG